MPKVTLDLNIDFELLRQQKSILLDLTYEKMIEKDEREAIEGVINLIDSIQDSAVEKGTLSEKEVFEISDEG